MWFLVAIDDTESVLGARRQKEVMSSTRVLYNLEHDVAAVRVYGIARGEVDPARVVQSSAVGNHLMGVVAVECDKVRYLDAFGINDGQSLSFVEREGDARPWCDFYGVRHWQQ